MIAYIRRIEDETPVELYSNSAHGGAPRLAASHTNGYYDSERTVGNVRAHLLAALAALDGLDPAAPIPLERIGQAAALAEAVDEIDHLLPSVIAWCVVKVYADRDWTPAVWTGHTTEEQAQAFRAVIDAHYTGQAKQNRWSVDRWTVELRECRIAEVMHPDASPEAYAAQLRR